MAKIFLTGPAGTGKTTRAAAHLREMLAGDTPAEAVLVLLPYPALAGPYRAVLDEANVEGVQVTTMSGLVLRSIVQFWPQVARTAGFGRPQAGPIFLNVETAQYYLRQAIAPLLEQGYFDPNVVPVRLPLPRLLIQILDNLNKAALLDLSPAEVNERLAAAIGAEPSSRVALEHAQVCAGRFRQFCLERNLLDFSLRVEIFRRHLWPLPEVRRELVGRYRHLIVDNLEEDNAFSHAILRDWLPEAESALLVYNEDAAYRLFLGASPDTARALGELCQETIRLADSHVAPADMLALGEHLTRAIHRTTPGGRPAELSAAGGDPRRVMFFQQERFYPQALDWAIDRIAGLLAEGVSPDQIVVLSPLVSDALRFAFVNGMARRGLPGRAHRPSRPLNEEPPVTMMLTLARLAFPEWGLPPEPLDVAQALSQAIPGLDSIRANLLVQVVYRPYEREQGYLTSFEQIEGAVRGRITEPAGESFDRLRTWLHQVRAGNELGLDEFWQRLAEELLSQPGFGLAQSPEAAGLAARLIESARRFREVAVQVPLPNSPHELPTIDQANRAYLDFFEQGILAARYRYDDEVETSADPAVLLTPVTSFLIENRPVDYQVWLDVGGSRWWERVAQPLTHPYVLSPEWETGRLWLDADEVASQRDWLNRVILGLTRRCRRQILMTNAEIGEQGYEQRGPLLIALQVMLRELSRTSKAGRAS